MNKLIIVLLSILSLNVFSQESLEVMPDEQLKVFEEIGIYTGYAAYADDPTEMIKLIHSNPEGEDEENTECGNEENLSRKEKRKLKNEYIVIKEKTDMKFYFRVIGPVEDIRNTQLARVDQGALGNELQSVIQAQGDGNRDAAIAEVCKGKTNMEKNSIW